MHLLNLDLLKLFFTLLSQHLSRSSSQHSLCLCSTCRRMEQQEAELTLAVPKLMELQQTRLGKVGNGA